MKPFLWDDHFITGLAKVDEQHKNLVDIINEYGTQISTGENISKKSVDKLLHDLADYAKQHFREEEELMRKKQLDTRHIKAHCIEHQGFLNDVGVMYSQLSTNKPKSAVSLLEFLMYWLAYHILGIDQSMARQIELIESGMPPEKAYDTAEQNKKNATEPLLKALNGLFKQVSDRNRELNKLNHTLEQRVDERTSELVKANLHLEEMALTDQLTNLPNRRHAMQSLNKAWQFSITHKLPLSLIIIDADGFKEINDTYGHDSGDKVLKSLSSQLVNAFRTDDLVCRMGGDEFMVICHNTPLEGAIHVAELARRSAEEMKVKVGDGYWNGSISLGVATRTANTTTSEELIKSADNAVYIAKNNGRNQVCS